MYGQKIGRSGFFELPEHFSQTDTAGIFRNSKHGTGRHSVEFTENAMPFSGIHRMEVTLNDHHREDFAKFEASIRTIDEVIECHLISGGYDYLLKFLTRGVAHYQSVIESILERDIGVGKYFSYIVIKSPIVKLHYPLAKLFSGGR